MPRIGKRMIKSSIAVFLCLMIDYIRITAFHGSGGIPFYSAVAAVLAMQTDATNSKTVAWTRIVGTFIGGLMGIIVLFIQRGIIPDTMPVLKNLLIAIAIIPVIYTTVLLDKRTASYISCVVFISVAVAHGENLNPILFTVNRILDTTIGIAVSLGLNLFHFPNKANKDILYVTNLDGTLMTSEGEISSISKIKLNRMIEFGANIAIATSRAPSAFLPIVEGIYLNLPVITMNGAALYDIQQEKYIKCKPMKKECTRQVIELFNQHKLNCFVNSVIRNSMHIYYADFTNSLEEEIYNSMSKSAHVNYVYSKFSDDKEALYIMAVNTDEIIMNLFEEIHNIESYPYLKIIYYKDTNHQGYSYLEVYDKDVSKDTALLELKKSINVKNIAAYGNDVSDIAMMKVADYKYAFESSNEELKDCGCVIISSKDKECVARSIEKSFYKYKV